MIGEVQRYGVPPEDDNCDNDSNGDKDNNKDNKDKDNGGDVTEDEANAAEEARDRRD